MNKPNEEMEMAFAINHYKNKLRGKFKGDEDKTTDEIIREVANEEGMTFEEVKDIWEAFNTVVEEGVKEKNKNKNKPKSKLAWAKKKKAKKQAKKSKRRNR